MKILHLISQHPESTGSGFYLQNIIRQAAAEGHRNYLVAGISDNQIPDLDCIETQSCRFVPFGLDLADFLIPGMSDIMPYPSSRFSTLSPRQLDIYEQIFRDAVKLAVYDFAPDIIHSHHLWIVSSVARKVFPDIPMVTSCHSTDLRQFEQCPNLRRRVLSHCRKIDRILALSHDQKANIKEVYSIDVSRIDIVGGGFDEDIFCLKPKKSPPQVQLLYGGKLSFAKGVDWLLRSFHDLQDENLHLHLAGSGTGEEGRKCLKLAAECGSAVTIHGQLSQLELARLMGLCHIFILPSFFEGLPLVLLEALASGCRIVTTDLPGCRELFENADPDFIEFVKLPVMKDIDRPDPEDLPLLFTRLQGAIMRMAARTLQSSSPDPEQVYRVTAPFGWEAVFSRIARAYEQAVSGELP